VTELLHKLEGSPGDARGFPLVGVGRSWHDPGRRSACNPKLMA